MTQDEFDAIRERALACDETGCYDTAYVAKCMVSSQDVGPLLDALSAAWEQERHCQGCDGHDD